MFDEILTNIPIVNEEDIVFFRLAGEIKFYVQNVVGIKVPTAIFKVGKVTANILSYLTTSPPDYKFIVRGWEMFIFIDEHAKFQDFNEVFNRFISRVNHVTIDSLNEYKWIIDFSPFKGEKVIIQSIKGVEIRNLNCKYLVVDSIPENKIKLVNVAVDKLEYC